MSAHATSVPEVEEHEVTLDLSAVSVPGLLALPAGAKGIVLFAHGSGSSRLSPRNAMVAGVLRASGFGTLLFDLLTPVEAMDRGNVFDIDLLSRRLAEATGWCRSQRETASLAVGYFGASTGAGAALVAAGRAPEPVRAVVSRGGRPDLAGDWLERVRAPTLLIVGGYDETVIALNRLALDRLTCEKRLEIVPGATHLFEEPGTLGAAARLAADWFRRYLPGTEI
jgi:putative phosphoribosyl transferase